jgi:SAM-dependent methyltransferase
MTEWANGMIRHIPHDVTEGLRQELAAFAGRIPQQTANLPTTLPAYLEAFQQSAEGLQFAQEVASIPAGARVLDIGVGRGQTSLFLAARGYRVSAVEPSPQLCQFIERAAELSGLSIAIYQTTAEAIDRLPVRDFEACIFNASLHHCDDPLLALRNCLSIMAPGGRILLLNEPVLRIFRSKARFAQLLRDEPSIGHYGGNEHIYYYHEYVDMLRQAGFDAVRDHVSLRYRNPESYLRFMKRVAGRREILARQAYYAAVRLLLRGGRWTQPAISLLQRLSLLQSYFTASKPAA